MPVIQRIYEPRGAARELFYCQKPEVLLSGAAGTGKSRACMEKLNLLAMKYPGMRALIVRKTLASLGSTTLVTWRTHVVNDALRAGIVKFYGGSQEEAAQYRYTNGSSITIGGLDKPTKIMSSEYDVIYVAEAIELTINDWEACTTRLRNGVMPYQQLIADTNPDTEFHWLYRRCLDGLTTMLHAKHTDNPIYANLDGTLTPLGDAYIEGKLAKLTGVRRARLYEGRWVSAEGTVYENYDPAIHVIDRFDIPQAWYRFWAIDFGYTNPFVLQWWAVDPDGRGYLYREIYRTGRLVEDHVVDALACVQSKHRDPARREWVEPKPRRVICDHDAEDRATFERHSGLSTVPAHKSVKQGIQAVDSRFKVQPDGKARLYLLRDSLVSKDVDLEGAGKPTSTEQEMPGYIWDRGRGKSPKEEPLKKDDHGCDATRYFVAEQDLAASPRLRWM